MIDLAECQVGIGSFIFGIPAEACGGCGRPTILLEVNFEARLCYFCSEALWQKYVTHCREHPLGPEDLTFP